jgi:hypothetical protein
MAASRDDVIGFSLALGIVLGTVALAHVLPAATSPAQGPASFDRDPTCAEWSDGCTVCQRTEQGPGCSTPGIACVPREQQCLRRT